MESYTFHTYINDVYNSLWLNLLFSVHPTLIYSSLEEYVCDRLFYSCAPSTLTF